MVSLRGKDINNPIDDEGNSPLHYAVQLGLPTVVKLLLKSGSRPQLTNRENQTPFHIAVQQEDGYPLKQLLKLTAPHEWPKDLKRAINADASSELSKVLKKYSKQLPVQEEESIDPIQKTQEKAASPDSKILQEDLNELKAFFEDESFDEAADFLEQKPSLLAEFKSLNGGELLQAIFENVSDYSSLKTTAIREGTDDVEENSFFSSADRLLDLLKKQGVAPEAFHGKQNVLLGVIHAKTDEEACYKLDLFLRYFPSSVAALSHDPIMPNATIADLALKRNLRNFFMKLNEFCGQQESGKQTSSCYLHDVVGNDNYELAESLLKRYPADVLNKKKQTPLMVAASKNNTRMMALLLSHGAIPDRVDLMGRNALYYALQAKAESAALFILPMLRCHNLPDRRGLTPLSLAAMKGILSIVRCLCSEANYTQTVDDLGHTALHKAAIAGEKEVIKYLVQQGFAIDQVEAPLRSDILIS